MTTARAPSLGILLISNRFAPAIGAGGTEILTQDLAHAFADRGHRVAWLAPEAPPDGLDPRISPISPPAPVTRSDLPQWREREAWLATAVADRLRELRRVDVAHVTHFTRTGLALLDQRPLAGTPVFATLTDYSVVCPDYQLWIRERTRGCAPGAPSSQCVSCVDLPGSVDAIASWRQRNHDWLNERVSGFWTQTPHQARQLARAGIDLRQLVDDRAHYDLPAAWESLPDDPPEPSYLLFVGRLSPEKGLDVLLEGYLRWRGELPLVIVGAPDQPEYEHTLRARAERDRRVRWHPPVPRRQLATLLLGAHALIIPSQWDENHPVAAAEALSLGVPVYCSSVPSMTHLAGSHGLRLVESYHRPESWREAMTEVASERQGRPCRTAVSTRRRVAEYRREFQTFVDTVIATYRKRVSV